MSDDVESTRPAPALAPAEPKQAELEFSGRLLDTAPDAIVVVDAAGCLMLVNLQAERLFGYAREELIGKHVEALVPERFRAAHVKHRVGFVVSPKVRPMGYGMELFGRRRDGSEFPMEISLSPLRVEGGMLISASIRDISERKQRELEMRRIQSHLLSAVESIPGAFAIFDTRDRLVLCNSSYRQLLGKEVSGDVVGRSFVSLIGAKIAAGTFDLAGTSAAELYERWLAYHRDPSGALDVRTAEGRSLRIVERRTIEGGTVKTIWDVTDDVEHEHELSRARAEAEAASLAKTEFLASMSHELRTPLNAVLGFAQLLQRDRKTPLTERQLERVEHVLRGGEHLLRLIDDVLDLARIEAGRVPVSLEPVGLAEVLSDVKATLDPMATRAEIELVVLPPPSELPEVMADRTRFKQILMNYGSNAIKYGRARTAVTFSASSGEGFVRVSVVDEGLGIADDQQDKIFQPFQRAGQETGAIEGTGIGLAITKRLAELMGGRVGFESRVGQGSRFWIELRPFILAGSARPAPRASIEPEVSPANVADGRRYLIVYIEDNPSNIAFMADLLTDFGRIDLLTAPTGEIGIELVRARAPDVVIMDINLPGMSGLEATRRLREWPETQQIPVIALSAAAMIRDAGRIQDAGFYRHLTKPVRVDDLARVLTELLARRPGRADGESAT
jgi:PAS domain S-box-containing protein